jgi:hypothetical protein
MAIELQCPCGKRLRLSAGAEGSQGRCPACGRVLDIPAAEVSAPSAVPLPVAADTSTALTDDPSGPAPERTAVTEAVPESGLAGETDELLVPARPSYKLASPGQVGLVAFLGGPLGGFLLMGRNYANCGRRAACWAMVAVGALVAAAVVGSGFVLPDMHLGLNLCLALFLWVSTYVTARVLQAPLFAAHRKQGGEQASGWAVLGFSVLGAGLTVGAAVGAAGLYEVGFGDNRLQVTAKEEIYYSRDVTEAEARTLGRLLQEAHFFNGGSEKTVQLRKDGQEYVLAIVLIFGFDDIQVHQEFRTLAGNVSHAFGGKPVRVELCDRWLTPKKTLPAERKP